MTKLTKEFFDDFVNTKGAFSCAEAVALADLVSKANEGLFLELGSHRGRSSMCIAKAMPINSSLILVEPEFKDSEWLNDVFLRMSKWYVDKTSVHFFAGYSLDALQIYNNISFCFIDSGVHDDMVTDECKILEDRMIKDGIIAFHDYGEKSQFTAVERAYNYMLSTGKYERIHIDWSGIFKYVKENNLDDGELSWHKYPELPHPPNFIGAIKRL